MEKKQETHDLGRALQRLREQSKFSDPVSFSKELNISYSTLRKWETGHRLIGHSTLLKFLELADASETTSLRLRQMRQDITKKRHAEYLPNLIVPKKLDNTVIELFKYVKKFCEYNDCELTEELSIDMKRKFEKIIKKELDIK